MSIFPHANVQIYGKVNHFSCSSVIFWPTASKQLHNGYAVVHNDKKAGHRGTTFPPPYLRIYERRRPQLTAQQMCRCAQDYKNEHKFSDFGSFLGLFVGYHLRGYYNSILHSKWKAVHKDKKVVSGGFIFAPSRWLLSEGVKKSKTIGTHGIKHRLFYITYWEMLTGDAGWLYSSAQK